MSDDDTRSCPPDPTRRKFLLTTGSGMAASMVAAYVPVLANSASGESASASAGPGPNIAGAVPITLRINGKDHEVRIDPRTPLLDCMREAIALTGTQKGCDHGQCGACTDHVDGYHADSRLKLALLNDGNEIMGIE